VSFLLKPDIALFGVKIITVLEEWKVVNASFLKMIAETEVVNIWQTNLSSLQNQSTASTSILHCSRKEKTKVKAEGDHHIGEFICPDAMLTPK
jgi:hypothetical protein